MATLVPTSPILPSGGNTPTDDECSMSSNEEEEDNCRIQAEQPFKLRELGNELYKNGQYKEATNIWLQSVKESLKRSVRNPSAALYENQFICRLNLCMGYLKLEDWTEAKDQAELVLAQRPDSIKALYRLAQALEQLQDWTECLGILDRLLHTVQEDSISLSETQSNEVIKIPEHGILSENSNKKETLVDISQNNLKGFTVEEIHRLVSQMKRRISISQAAYRKKEKRVMRGIGRRLNEIGVSTDRYTDSDNIHDQLCINHSTNDSVNLTQSKNDFIGTSIHDIITWNYETPELDIPVDTDVMLDKKKQEQLLITTATPVIKHIVKDSGLCDDPTSDLWIRHYDMDQLIQDRRSVVLSLPFTVLHGISLILNRKQTKESTNPIVFNEEDWENDSPQGILRKQLIRCIKTQKQLTIHVLGSRGDTEMESQWTSILKRLNDLKILRIIFIGFLDTDDRWNQSLHEGILSPPLTKTEGLTSGKKLTCWLYKGLYQLYLKDYPTVLTDPCHVFHPDLVLIPEPQLSRYFNSWIPIFDQLLKTYIPTLITGYSAKDVATHDAHNLPIILQHMKANCIIPFVPNPYSVYIKPSSNIPPMPLWVPEGEEPMYYSGVSGKHAVIGCFLGRSTPLDESIDVEEFKKSLRGMCDIDSQEFADKDLYEIKERYTTVLQQTRDDNLSVD